MGGDKFGIGAGGGKKRPDAGSITRRVGQDADTGKAPGKATPSSKLKPGAAAPASSGDDYIDKGSHHDETSFLNAGQRDRLVNAFQHRTLAAELNYQSAATDARVDKLVEKEDDSISWVASLMIDLALGFVVGRVISSLTRVQGQHYDNVMNTLKVEDLIGHETEPSILSKLKDKASTAFARLTDDQIRAQVTAAAAIGKTKGLEMAVKERGKAGESTKQADVGYIEQLKDAASIAYQQFRESIPALVGDAELLVLFDAMDARNHLVSQYKQAITEKIKRFEDSKVTKIGRNNETKLVENEHDGSVSSDALGEKTERAVWVQWQVYVSGYPTELVFRHQDGPQWNGVGEHAKDRGTKEKMPNATSKAKNGISIDPHAIYIVPEEFREVAIARHRQAWGAAPEEVTIDDESYQAFDPVRAQKARDNKAAAAKPVQHLPAPKEPAPPEPPKQAPGKLGDVFKADIRTGKRLP